MVSIAVVSIAARLIGIPYRTRLPAPAFRKFVQDKRPVATSRISIIRLSPRRHSHEVWYSAVDGAAVERLLRRIAYTTHVSGTPVANRSVEFYYDERSPAAHAYVNGLQLGQSKLLTRIEVSGPVFRSSGPLYRIYRLSYKTGMTGEPLLDSFTECDANNICKQSVRFDWTTTLSASNVPYLDFNTGLPLFGGVATAFGMNRWERIHTADMNGDGCDDLLALDTNQQWQVLLSDFGPHGQGRFGSPIPSLSESAIVSRNAAGELVNVVLPFEHYSRYLDTDSDNRADLLRVVYQSPLAWFDGRYQSCHARQTSVGFDCGFVESVPAVNYFSNAYLGDFDGDSHVDLIRQFGGLNGVGSIYSAMNIVAGSGYAYSPVSGPNGPQIAAPATTSYVLDLDGDRRSEMVDNEIEVDPTRPGQYRATGWLSAFNLDAAGQSVPRAINLPSLEQLRAASGDLCPRHIFADVNGDGLVDSVVPNCQRDPDLFINTGNGFLAPVSVRLGGQAAVPAPRYSSSQRPFNDGIRVIDVNGDGRQDILYSYSNQGVMALVAQPDASFVLQRLWAKDAVSGVNYPIPDGDQSEDGPHVAQVFDANGDGAPDFLQYVGGVLHVYIAQPQPADLLQAVTQQGGTEALVVRYDSGSDHAVVAISLTPSASFPQMDADGRGLFVVSQVTMRDGPGGSAITEHHSYGLPMSDVRAGWLGFGTHTVTGPTVSTVYEFDRRAVGPPSVPYPLRGLPIRTKTTGVLDSAGRSLVRIETDHYEVVTGQAIGSSVRLLKTRETDGIYEPTGAGQLKLLTATAAEHDKFDDFGFAWFDRITWSSVNGVERTDEATSAWDHLTGGTDWMLGLRSSRCVVSSDAGGRSQSRCEEASFDRQTGAQSNHTLEPGLPAVRLVTTYLRDRFGNIERVERRDSSGHVRAESATFDSDFVFASSETDALGSVQLIEVHPGFGVPVSTTDMNQITTARQVDGFGRLKALSYAGGEVVSWRLDSGGGFTAQGVALVASQTRSSRSGISRTYFDGFGRVLWTENSEFGGRVIRRQNSYDPTTGWLNSQLGPMAVPSIPGQVAAKTVISRDLIGRPVRFDDSGAVTEISYDGLTETVVDPSGHTTRKIAGPLGLHSIERLDANKAGVITQLEYGPFGLVVSSTQKARNGDTQVSHYSYDVVGRTRRIVDEANTASEFTYSSFGELVTSTQFDALGVVSQSTQATYDDLGRVLTSIDSNGTFHNVYTWDTAPHGKGRLSTATSISGVETVFEYDALSRPTRETTTFDGESFSFYNTYDRFGRLEELFYPSPSGLGQKFVTLRLGYDGFSGVTSKLTSPNLPSRPMWRLREVDQGGRITRVDLGNGVVERGSYDALGRVLSLTNSTSTGQTLRDRSYTYYANGNMRSRADLVQGWREVFTHDFLDRLSSQSFYLAENLVAVDSLTYDDFGNLETRTRGSEQLAYAYGTGKAPHGRNAVTELVSAERHMQYGYDERGNQVEASGVDTDTGVLALAPRRQFAFTSFDLPLSSVESSWRGGRYVTEKFEFVYDAFNRRFARVNLGTGERTIERGTAFRRTGSKGNERWEVVFRSPTGPVASFSTDKTGTQTELRFLHSDALGNVDTTTDIAGTVLEQRSFSPLGEVFDPTTGKATTALVVGFTGARHDSQGLINFNGRIYDSLTARFLSKDPINGAPANSQSYNRYSYVWNMPLALRDPSGWQTEGDWSDAHGAGASSSSPLGDGLDPIRIAPAPAAPPRRTPPSAITPTVPDVGPATEPEIADDTDPQVMSDILLSEETSYEAVFDGFTDFIRDINDSGNQSLVSMTHFVVDYAPVAGEVGFQTAMTIGDFLQTALVSTLLAGPNGCQCNVPRVQEKFDEFSDRQDGRNGAVQNVRMQAAKVHGMRPALSDSNVRPKLLQGNKKWGLDHIVQGHGWTSLGNKGTAHISQFSKMSIKELRVLIREAAESGAKWVPEGNSRVLNADMGRTIGTDHTGAATSWLRVIINAADEVISAYPVAAP